MRLHVVPGDLQIWLGDLQIRAQLAKPKSMGDSRERLATPPRGQVTSLARTLFFTEEMGLLGCLPSPFRLPVSTPHPGIVQTGGLLRRLTLQAKLGLLGWHPGHPVAVNILAVKVEHSPACSDSLPAEPTKSVSPSAREQQPPSQCLAHPGPSRESSESLGLLPQPELGRSLNNTEIAP